MIDPAIAALGFEDHLDVVRRFTDDELIPREAEMVAEGAVPDDLVARLAEVGLFAITIPRAHGGLGWTQEQQVRLTLEFTRASVVYRSRFSTTIGLASQILVDHGTDEQRRHHLPAMAAGQMVSAFALTEEAAGSDAGAVATTATRDGDEYVITGDKRYITNGAWADLFLVFARTSAGAAGGSGLSCILVPASTPGIETRLPPRMNGHEAGPVAEVDFRDVRVPVANLVGGEEGAGLRHALRGINHARTHVAATAVGQSARMLEEAVRFAGGRTQFGQPIGRFGAVEAMLGESYAELAAGRALVLDVARAFDAGDIPRHRIAAAKLYCTEMASRIADRCVQVLGGAGIVGDHPIPRMWRDVRALRIYEGTSQIHQRNLARHLEGLAGEPPGALVRGF